MLAHPASVGHGLNLQKGGHIIVWFGNTWSLELYQQFNARILRQGQQEGSVIIHHLVVHKTHDVDVIKAISNKDTNDKYIRTLIKIIHIYLKKYINSESNEDHCDIFTDDEIKNKIQCVVNNEEPINKLLLMNSDTAINIDAFELLCNLKKF